MEICKFIIKAFVLICIMFSLTAITVPKNEIFVIIYFIVASFLTLDIVSIWFKDYKDWKHLEFNKNLVSTIDITHRLPEWISDGEEWDLFLSAHHEREKLLENFIGIWEEIMKSNRYIVDLIQEKDTPQNGWKIGIKWSVAHYILIEKDPKMPWLRKMQGEDELLEHEEKQKADNLDVKKWIYRQSKLDKLIVAHWHLNENGMVPLPENIEEKEFWGLQDSFKKSRKRKEEMADLGEKLGFGGRWEQG